MNDLSLGFLWSRKNLTGNLTSNLQYLWVLKVRFMLYSNNKTGGLQQPKKPGLNMVKTSLFSENYFFGRH